MAQFSVHGNPGPARADYPLLLDVQSDLIAGINTRVVVPLCPVDVLGGRAIRGLTPAVEVHGTRYLMLTPQLAGVPLAALGPEVASLSGSRDAILAALELLITGI